MDAGKSCCEYIGAICQIGDAGLNPFHMKFVKNARSLDDLKPDIHSNGRRRLTVSNKVCL